MLKNFGFKQFDSAKIPMPQGTWIHNPHLSGQVVPDGSAGQSMTLMGGRDRRRLFVWTHP